jgi:hypothetical protein
MAELASNKHPALAPSAIKVSFMYLSNCCANPRGAAAR